MKQNIVSRFLNSERYHDLPKSLRKGKYIFIFSMLIVALINFVIFYLYQNLSAILMAFKTVSYVDGQEVYTWSLFHFREFVKELSYSTSNLSGAIRNTLIFFVTNILILLPANYFVAYFLYKKVPCSSFFRVIFFLPSIISTVVLVGIFKSFIAPNGFLSMNLEKIFGTLLPPFLKQDSTAKWTVLFFCVWTGFSGNVLLFQGAMNRIPKEVVEAGALDGVNSLQEVWYIILPMVWETFSTILTLGMVGVFTSGGPILLFTEGNYDTYTISYWIFAQVKFTGQQNYAAAVGLIFTLLTLPIVLLTRKISNRVYKEIEY